MPYIIELKKGCMGSLRLRSHDSFDVGRRQSITLVAGAIGALAGCLGASDRNDDQPSENGGRLSVEIRSEVDRSFRAEVALLEAEQQFEAGRLAQMNFATTGDIQAISKPDVTGGPFRIVIRFFDYLEDQEVDQHWDLDECIEFNTRVTVREDEVAVSTGCTLADGD